LQTQSQKRKKFKNHAAEEHSFLPGLHCWAQNQCQIKLDKGCLTIFFLGENLLKGNTKKGFVTSPLGKKAPNCKNFTLSNWYHVLASSQCLHPWTLYCMFLSLNNRAFATSVAIANNFSPYELQLVEFHHQQWWCNYNNKSLIVILLIIF